MEAKKKAVPLERDVDKSQNQSDDVGSKEDRYIINERRKIQHRAKLRHTVFPHGLPPRHYMLNFRDQTRLGAFIHVWP